MNGQLADRTHKPRLGLSWFGVCLMLALANPVSAQDRAPQPKAGEKATPAPQARPKAQQGRPKRQPLPPSYEDDDAAGCPSNERKLELIV
jgi:hypothetical protein